MNPEHLMLVGPADLKKVRIECPTCRTAVTVDLSPDGHIAKLGACVGCEREMGSVAERKAATDLLQALGGWQRHGVALRVRFELSPMAHLAAVAAQAGKPQRE
jgi:hypothetical protein